MVSTPDELQGATHVIVPGVGHFSQAMQQLRAHNLVDPIINRYNYVLLSLLLFFL